MLPRLAPVQWLAVNAGLRRQRRAPSQGCKRLAHHGSLVLDNFDINLNQAIYTIKQASSPGQPLFGLDAKIFNAILKKAAMATNLQDLVTLLKRRTEEGVRRRGRWNSYASVRRYGKMGRLQKAAQETPTNVWSYGLLASKNLQEWIRYPRRAAKPPML